jgi:phosphopantetheinyl transferase (holo-ACP synthase)
MSRFEALLAREAHPIPSVFTAAEVERARASDDPARDLCACFCAKEAVAKAIGSLYDFTACEFQGTAEGSESELSLSDAFRAEHGVGSARIVVRDVPDAPGDLLAVAYLFA